MPKTSKEILDEFKKQAENLSEDFAKIDAELENMNLDITQRYAISRMLETKYRKSLKAEDIQMASIIIKYTKKPKQ